jgi:tetratricopeptide (TPR) repeat protein
LSHFSGTDRFSILRRLGSGGFGQAYEAFDHERQARVALKVPHDSAGRAISQFKREFRTLAGLTHPHLVRLFEVMSHGPEWFFTMELVEGKTFFDHLCPGGGPARDFARVRTLMGEVAQGLWALHRTGNLHRNLKPSHARVGPDGRVVLLDYGFTADAQRGTSDTFQIAPSPGALAHMAPERIGGHAPTEAGDWYSAGVMLYQVLTGVLPFPGDTLSALIDKMRGDAPRPDLGPEVPADLGALCMDLLARKPALRPTGAQVLERLGVAVPAPIPSLVPPRRLRSSRLLIARKTELAALGRASETSLQGKTVVVFVHGESGMGKSYLLRRFMRRLKRDDPRTVVLVGHCSEEGSAPYKALGSLMEDLAEHLGRLAADNASILLPRDIHCLARLFPVLQKVAAIATGGVAALPSPDPQELRRRAFVALRELLMRLGTRYPLVLVLEDLQWGDPDSAALFSHLLRDPDPPSMLVVLSYRTGAGKATSTLKALQLRLAEEGTEVLEIPVEKIPPAESRALALALLGSFRPDSAAEAAWVAQESGGDPFFIGELTRHLRSGIRIPDGAGDHTLDAYILFRVGSLPEIPRIILETLALAGHPVKWETLRRACGVEAGPEVLTALRAGHLIRVRGGQDLLLETYHDRIRQSVLRRFPQAEARAIHLALALALEQESAPDAQTLCRHFQAAGVPDKAGRYALLAAEEAVAALAFGRAAELFRRALVLLAPRGQEQVEILVQLGDALAGAGLGHKAAQVYLRALPEASVRDSLRLERRASEEFFRSGHFDQGEAALDAVMGRIGMKAGRRPWSSWLSERICRLRLRIRGYGFKERVEAQIPQADLDRIDVCWAGAMGLGPVEHIRSGELQSRHLLLALDAGEPFRIVRALAMETLYVSQRGNRSQAVNQRLQGLTLALAERIGHPNPVSRAMVAAGAAALMQGRWKQAVDLLERAEALLRDNCTGLDFELHLAQYYALLGRYEMGGLRDIEIRVSSRMQAAQDKGDLLAITNLRTTILPRIHLVHDEPGRAERELDQAIAAWSTAGYHLQHYGALVSRVAIRLYAGDPEQALVLLADHWKLLRRSRLLKVQNVRVTCLELRARTSLALALKEPEDAWGRAALLRSARRDIRRLEAEGVEYGRALALKLHALEALVLGRPDEAGALLFQAEMAFQSCNMLLQAMAVRFRRGLMEGPVGAEQVEAADRWMRSQRIANPPRYVAMHLPGQLY